MPRSLIQRILGDSAEVTLANGETLSAGIVVLAAGYKSFPMLEKLTGVDDLGSGVKGQALIAKVGQKGRIARAL